MTSASLLSVSQQLFWPHRWAIPIMAAMHAENATRFSILARRLAISKSVLSTALDMLENQGWIARNPGHGHPLRPEYLLTAAGKAPAQAAARINAACANLGFTPAALGKWSLPVLIALGQGVTRFNLLQNSLAPITPRALSLALAQLTALDLIAPVRKGAGHPIYQVSSRGRKLTAILNAGE